MTNDPVSEAIEKEFANTKFARGGGACFECCDYEGIYTDLLSFTHRIAALSYARGVEDSARIVENERQNTPDLVESRTLSRAASAIRSLTRNTTHPCTCGNRGYTALVENKHFPDCPAVPITPHKDTV